MVAVTTFSQGWDTKKSKTCSPRKTHLPDPKGRQLPKSIPKKEFHVPNIQEASTEEIPQPIPPPQIRQACTSEIQYKKVVFDLETTSRGTLTCSCNLLSDLICNPGNQNTALGTFSSFH